MMKMNLNPKKVLKFKKKIMKINLIKILKKLTIKFKIINKIYIKES